MVASMLQKENASILVHDDYCKATSPETISNAIYQISKIVSGAYCRATSTQDVIKAGKPVL